MKYKLFIYFFASNLLLFSQKIALDEGFGIEKKNTTKSNITKLDPSSFEKVVVRSALYDYKKNNLPYYVQNKTTDLSVKASAKLVVKSTVILEGQAAEIIKANFSKYLTNDFQISNVINIASEKNINSCKIIPFKINESAQIIELVDYSLNWETEANPLKRKSQTNLFSSSSVLASGKWYKIAITQDGVYKLDQSFFNDAGIPIQGINPKNIRIYGNGGHILPEMNGDFRYDDLQQNSIVVVGEGDNIFNTTDFVMFYGQGKTRWDRRNDPKSLLFSPTNNFYSDTSFYYLNLDLGLGKRITSQASNPNSSNVNSNTFDYYVCHEVDVTNFVKSGRNMYGEYFDINNSYSFVFPDGNFVLNDTIRAETTIAGRGLINNVYDISVNNLNYFVTVAGYDITNYLADYAAIETGASKALNNSYGSITAVISKLTANTVGWLDKISINARREMTYNGNAFNFRDSRITAPGNICNYNVNSGGITNFNIWNVTDFINPYQQIFSNASNICSFNANADSLNEYVAFSSDNLPKPVFYGAIDNQNLHSLQQADYVIVTPPEFLSYANRLATLHQQQEGLSYLIVTTTQLYNEFSSGKIDICAIRDFTRMLYSRGIGAGVQPKYLLLVGRGSYYNKNGRAGNTNFIPTYETENSVSVIYSVASDDFYGLMDDDEGYLAESIGGMDIGVGRLTITSTTEADDVVKKIENYYKTGPISYVTPDNCSTTQATQVYGDWRDYILFCADDGDASLHMEQADNLSTKVKAASPAYNIVKVYIDAYKGLATPGGRRYPDMQAAFNSRIDKGCLIMNYTGHGGEVGLSAERVVDIPTINSWTNFNSLPLFVTATCEFSRYDDPDRISAGELCLLNPKGGSVAMFTTCRLAFSNYNETLNNKLFDFMFFKNPNNKMPALGDIVRNTKANLLQNFFYSNFHLLGDPALTLAYPRHTVLTSQINGKPLNINVSDTIRGLSKVTVRGYVADENTLSKITNFNGIVYPVIFDKSDLVTCLLNDPASSLTSGTLTPFQFISQQNVIYKGKAIVTNGDFAFSFTVPKDVSFSYGNSKFSYYATDGYTDANGSYDSVKVGGLDPTAKFDSDGPKVKLYLNSASFVNGGVTNENPILNADLVDSSGINTVGTGFGHDITATLDQNSNKPFVLNDFYEANLNSYQSGKVKYQLSDLPDGNHNVAFKVWDVQNNSSTASADFIVAKSADLALSMVLNYPNPFTTSTRFFFEHNRNCEDLKVGIQIYTISGKLAKSIYRTVNCEGFRNEGIQWDGRDDFGDKLGRGVYIYKVSVTDMENKKAEKIEKLVILN